MKLPSPLRTNLGWLHRSAKSFLKIVQARCRRPDISRRYISFGIPYFYSSAKHPDSLDIKITAISSKCLLNMRFQAVVPLLLALAPVISAWGSLGHATIAHVATDFRKHTDLNYNCIVSLLTIQETVDAATKFQTILADTSTDYLASVASWVSVIVCQAFHLMLIEIDRPIPTATRLLVYSPSRILTSMPWIAGLRHAMWITLEIVELAAALSVPLITM